MIKNNRGTSLIELIISVCIMMLIILPTYGAFQSALKSTNRAEEVTYAQTATQAVLEEIKYLGKTGVLEASQSGVTGEWVFHQGNQAEHVPDYYSLVNDHSGAYIEGTEAFEVRVYFDTAAYSVLADDPNKYQYSDLSDFAGECSEIINPEVSTVNYDTLAEEYFVRQYIDYEHAEWEAAWAKYEDDYLQYYDQLRAYEQRKKTDPENAGTKPVAPVEPGAFTDPRDLPTYNEANFLSCIQKDQQLQVVPNPAGEGYMLSSVITYNFDITNSWGYNCTSDTRTFSGFCEKAINARTESLYVLYTPKDPYLMSGRDRVTVINGMYDPTKNPEDQIINIFIVVQTRHDQDIDYTDDTTTGILDVFIPATYRNHLNQQVTNHAECLKIHSQALLNFPSTIEMPGQTPSWSSNEEADKQARLLRIIDNQEGERINNVTVKILPFGTTAAAGSAEEDSEALAVLTSTVVK